MQREKPGRTPSLKQASPATTTAQRKIVATWTLWRATDTLCYFFLKKQRIWIRIFLFVYRGRNVTPPPQKRHLTFFWPKNINLFLRKPKHDINVDHIECDNWCTLIQAQIVGTRGGTDNMGWTTSFKMWNQMNLLEHQVRFLFFPILWCSQNDDHPQEGLAKFKYRLGMKIKEISRFIYIFAYMLEPNREISRFVKKIIKIFLLGEEKKPFWK
jgi:hypothetical protein